MKTIKVSEATGPALDWLVAKCKGLNVTIPAFAEHPWVQVHHPDGAKSLCPAFSTDWSQGGPIIAREKIDLLGSVKKEVWLASVPRPNLVGWRFIAEGPTPLIAAMRCYCTSKLGDTVEVPEELL